MAEDYDRSIAKLDAYRARRVGQMLVAGAEPEYEEEPESVLEVSDLDGKQLVADFTRSFECFSTTPFDPSGARLRLYPGGVSIWSGFPGAGKTTLLRQLACHLLAAGEGVFYASLEEDPRDLLVRLAATASGRELPTAHQMQWFIDAYGQKFRVWSRVGLTRHRKLLAAVRKVAEQGITHAVIDSLMCMDIDNGNFEAQRQFANLLAATARVSRVHIHLVAHPRKLISSNQEPDINDVAGAREIGGISDNVIFVRRSQDEPANPLQPVTPMCVSIRKQRHGYGSLGDIAGWFHRNMRQFHLDQWKDRPTRYLPEDAYS
jgi:twinkle protein